MIERIDWILEFVREHDAESFRGDTRTWLAVQMAFVQIGEAASRIPDEIKRTPASNGDRFGTTATSSRTCTTQSIPCAFFKRPGRICPGFARY
jgi:hypothetical protein